ncbi:hypothetical protein [Butyrivibrio proteoclasticus]|uniref:hypothetical protein n=1 Tax=Butyrivibrio proteoclasticus TaxID=43305 RepID=UPI00047C71E2|nr:hypothetical protein [Butyrivibrio proteoclasticus]
MLGTDHMGLFKKIMDEGQYDPNVPKRGRQEVYFLMYFFLSAVLIIRGIVLIVNLVKGGDYSDYLMYCRIAADFFFGITLFLAGLGNLADFLAHVRYYKANKTIVEKWEDVSVAGLTFVLINILPLLLFGWILWVSIKQGDVEYIHLFTIVDSILAGIFVLGFIVWRWAKGVARKIETHNQYDYYKRRRKLG